TAEQNRLRHALPPVRPKVAAPSAWLEQALKELDTELDQPLHALPLWRDRDHLLRSVPGVGPPVALTVIAHLPERGRAGPSGAERGQGSVKQDATLGGLAPRTRDSGAWRGTRAIWGGRRQGRAARAMAALVGVRHHPVLHALYERLLARGKPKKVALTACLQKRLTILHAVLRDRMPWQPTLLAT